MRHRNPATDLALIAVFAALIAAGSWTAIAIPGNAVPITLQTLMVALVGLVLGPWRGALSVLLYLAVGLAGLPVFAGGKAGVGVLASPSAGYLLSFVLEAIVVGLLAQLIVRRGRRGAAFPFLLFAAALAGSIVVVHPLGIVGLMVNGHLSFGKAFAVDMAFWIGDLLKCAVAALVAVTVHKAFPGVLNTRRAVAAQA